MDANQRATDRVRLMIRSEEAVSVSKDRRNDLFRARNNKLSQITTMEKQIEQLMEDDANVDTVGTKSRKDYVALIQDFRDLNDGLQQFMTKEEFRNNQIRWFYPKNKVITNFYWKCEEWIKEVRKRSQKAEECDEDDIKSASPKSTGRCPSGAGSHRGSAWSATSTVRLKVELERASLQAKSAALNAKLAIEREEAEFQAEQKRKEADFEAERKRMETVITARKQKHAMETAIAEWKAKMEVLQKYEYSQELEEQERTGEHTLYGSMVHASRCTICLSHQRSCVFLECGHVCTCTLCYDALSEPKKCPICRATIDRMVHIYNI
nr:uncharacterized protein LOC133616183 [Nerophis lumbriciformis]XP_061831319.1 uncharacterized protein LOC133616183 [Nerophis lumbriciformis]